MTKKPNFADIVDQATDPRQESAFLSEAEEDHSRRMAQTGQNAPQENADSSPEKKPETLSKRANFLLKPSVHARFKNYTKNHQLTMNAVVNELIEEYLKDHNA